MKMCIIVLIIFPDIFNLTGLIYYKYQKYNNAIECFNRQNNSSDKYFNLGCAYYKIEDYQSAEKYFQLSLNEEKTKKNPKIFYNLGNCYFKLNDFEKAKKYYIETLILEPDNFDAKYNLSLLLLLQQKQKEKENNQESNQPQPISKNNDKKKQSKANHEYNSFNEKFDDKIAKTQSEIIMKSIIYKYQRGKGNQFNNKQIRW